MSKGRHTVFYGCHKNQRPMKSIIQRSGTNHLSRRSWVNRLQSHLFQHIQRIAMNTFEMLSFFIAALEPFWSYTEYGEHVTNVQCSMAISQSKSQCRIHCEYQVGNSWQLHCNVWIFFASELCSPIIQSLFRRCFADGNLINCMSVLKITN